MKKKIIKGMTAAQAGKLGGEKSRRTLTTEQARAMIAAREKKRGK